MARALALLFAVLAGCPAGAQEQIMGNHRYVFPYEIRLGPLTYTQLVQGPNQAPDGTETYCYTCQCAADGSCADGGSGAFAFRVNGSWQCFCSGTVVCRAVGDACVNNIDCCTAACQDGVCINPTSTTLSSCDLMAEVASCPFFCDTINDCPCATTTTTAAPTTTTTVTTTSTTAGTGSTTTVSTTTAPATTTTINFANTGFVFAQNLPQPTVDQFEEDGQIATSAPGTGALMPAHGTARTLIVVTSATPFNQYHANHGVNCGGGGPACPVWTVCLQQSNTPFNDSAYSDTSLCCTINPIVNQCQDSTNTADVKDGGLLTFHLTANSDPPANVGASVEIHP